MPFGDNGISCGRCLIEQNVVTGNANSIMMTGGGVVLGNAIVGNGGYGLGRHCHSNTLAWYGEAV